MAITAQLADWFARSEPPLRTALGLALARPNATRDEVRAALLADPEDRITRGLAQMIDEVSAGLLDARFEVRGDQKSLLLVGDYVGSAQYQPPQSAMNDLKIIVPGRESAQAFEVSPGGVRHLDDRHERSDGPNF